MSSTALLFMIELIPDRLPTETCRLQALKLAYRATSCPDNPRLSCPYPTQAAVHVDQNHGLSIARDTLQKRAGGGGGGWCDRCRVSATLAANQAG